MCGLHLDAHDHLGARVRRGVKAGGEVGDVPFSSARAQTFLQKEAFAELASWC
jgi:hypothetical protein